MPAKRSKKKSLAPDVPLRRSTRPRKVVSLKGTCGAPAARKVLRNSMPQAVAPTKVATSGPVVVTVQEAQPSSIKFREETGTENYVEVTIRGKPMINETVRTSQTFAQHHCLL